MAFFALLYDQPLNTPIAINGPNPDHSFNAGTNIQAEFTQGVGGPNDPQRGTPAIQLTGTYPDWTISIDDGGDPTGPGEPDFNDIVVTVHATPVGPQAPPESPRRRETAGGTQ